MKSIQFMEAASIAFTLAYNFLLIRQNIWCWPAGLLSSLFGAWVMAAQHLPGQSILYLFYAAMAIYGFVYWWKGKEHHRPITEWKKEIHWILIILLFLLSLMIYLNRFNLFHADIEFWDIGLTLFCVIATFMETRKILSAWLYWIVLNAVSIWLYASHAVYGLSILSAVYVFLSVRGYLIWKKEWKTA